MNDPKFEEALVVFKKAILNRFHERKEELDKRRNEKITSRMMIGQLSDPVHPNFALFREHAPKIGQDFIVSFKETITPYCGRISDQSQRVLLSLLEEKYMIAIRQAEDGLKRLLISLGRYDPDRSLGARQTYLTALGEQRRLLEEDILKHNLNATSQKQAIALPAADQRKDEYIPKHKIVKKEVDDLLNSLRLEDPASTLEKAKRIYAHLQGESYSAVNKMYHYKSKKH